MEVPVEVIHPRCAGLDVHKATVVASVRLARGRKVERHTETFGTTTGELLRLVDWLQSWRVTHVGLEATGVYWKPVWHILERHFALVLGNAREMRNVPGRKTDVSDAEWIADLVAHGLIRGSFVPPEPIQELRDLTRTRKQLVRQRTQHLQRIEKILEDANVKLSSVVTDVQGMSGRAILEALAQGETDPERLADLTSDRLKASREQQVEALRGQVRDHHRFMLRLHLGQIDGVDRAIAAVESQIETVLEPFRRAVDHLLTIPGVSNTVAAVIIAEIGTDMSRFPTHGHLLSWAGLCPGQDESAGKRRSTRSRRGGWLKTILVQAAWAAVRTKDSYLRAQFLRLRARRGAKKAILAVAASILTAVYYMIKNDVDYKDLGADYFPRRDQKVAAFDLVRRLEHLGYRVQLSAAA
jgi:transposase